ncbi:Hypothetical_protein [Hexamita inflata]|uniref:Hypothetical_protein n=1 Tax=Hexamita inflata TaxID=28002 RepID=A0AA86N9J9_9EUKA|nr:Hypothetical protein HINF_LOCUS3252 [Hexamita inflata]
MDSVRADFLFSRCYMCSQIGVIIIISLATCTLVNEFIRTYDQLLQIYKEFDIKIICSVFIIVVIDTSYAVDFISVPDKPVQMYNSCFSIILAIYVTKQFQFPSLKIGVDFSRRSYLYISNIILLQKVIKWSQTLLDDMLFKSLYTQKQQKFKNLLIFEEYFKKRGQQLKWKTKSDARYKPKSTRFALSYRPSVYFLKKARGSVSEQRWWSAFEVMQQYQD